MGYDNVDEYMAGVPAPSLDDIPVDIPGAAAPVVIHGVRGVSPKVTVGGARARSRFLRGYEIPMADGGVTFLKARNFPFGFYTFTWGDTVVFQNDRPTPLGWVALVLPYVGFLLFFKVYLAILFGMLANYGIAALLKRPHLSPWVRYGIPIAFGVSTNLVSAWLTWWLITSLS